MAIFKTVNIISNDTIIFNQIPGTLEELYGKLRTNNAPAAIRTQSIDKPYVVKLNDNYYGWINKNDSADLDDYDKACLRKIDRKLNSNHLESWY